MPDREENEFLTLAEAAERCGTSSDTVRRRLHAGLIPGAEREGPEDNAPWRIPVAGLVASGLLKLNGDQTGSTGLRARFADLERVIYTQQQHIDAQQQHIETQRRYITILERASGGDV
jgi:hypothetical protein